MDFVKNQVILDLEPGEILFDELDQVESIFYILDGLVKLSRVSKEGNVKIIELLGKNDFIGVVLMLREKREYGFRAEILRKTRVIKLSKEQLNTALLLPELRDTFLGFVFDKLIDFSDKLAQDESIEDRITWQLSELQRKFGYTKAGSKFLELPVTKTDLASMLGIRRETLSRKMSELEKNHIIKMYGNTIKFL